MGKHTAEATRGSNIPRFAMKLAGIDYKAVFGIFWLRYGIVVSVTIFMVLWTALTCTIVGLSVKKHTTAEVTDQLTRKYEQDLQDYKDTIAAERQAEYEASEAASRKTTIESAATEMAKAFEGIKGITENPDSLRTYGWNMAFRVSSREYPNTFEEVISQKNQYMGYSPGNPVIEKKYQIALEVVTAYYNGTWPVSNDFLYAEWDRTGKIILRDEYLAGRSTNYWWYGK